MEIMFNFIESKQQFARLEADPGMEGVLIDRGMPDETFVDQKLEEPEEYDAGDQVVAGMDMEKEQRGKQAETIGTCDDLQS